MTDAVALKPRVAKNTDTELVNSYEVSQFADLAFEFNSDSKVENALSISRELESVSLKSLFNSDDLTKKAEAIALFHDYVPLLKRAFPIEGETEDPKTYAGYLLSPEARWDMHIIRDKHDGTILGGVQGQALRVDSERIDTIFWAEHIFAVPEAQNQNTFLEITRTVQQAAQKDGAKLIMMEFNDSTKMTEDEVAEDLKGGLHPKVREVLWNHYLECLYYNDPVSGERRRAPYSQPSMDGQPPVEMLSTGIFKLDDSISEVHPSELKAIYKAMWDTICESETDPTAVGIFEELDRVTESGQVLYFDDILTRKEAKEALKLRNYEEIQNIEDLFTRIVSHWSAGEGQIIAN